MGICCLISLTSGKQLLLQVIISIARSLSNVTVIKENIHRNECHYHRVCRSKPRYESQIKILPLFSRFNTPIVVTPCSVGNENKLLM